MNACAHVRGQRANRHAHAQLRAQLADQLTRRARARATTCGCGTICHASPSLRLRAERRSEPPTQRARRCTSERRSCISGRRNERAWEDNRAPGRAAFGRYPSHRLIHSSFDTCPTSSSLPRSSSRRGKGEYEANLARLGEIFAQLDSLEPRPDVLHLPEAGPHRLLPRGRRARARASPPAPSPPTCSACISPRAAGSRPLEVAIGFYELWNSILYNSAMWVRLGGDAPLDSARPPQELPPHLRPVRRRALRRARTRYPRLRHAVGPLRHARLRGRLALARRNAARARRRDDDLHLVGARPRAASGRATTRFPARRASRDGSASCATLPRSTACSSRSRISWRTRGESRSPGGATIAGPERRRSRARAALARGARRDRRSTSTISRARAPRCRCSRICRPRCRICSTTSSRSARRRRRALDVRSGAARAKRAARHRARQVAGARAGDVAVVQVSARENGAPPPLDDRRRAHRGVAHHVHSRRAHAARLREGHRRRSPAASTPPSPRSSPRARSGAETSSACGFRIARRAPRVSSTRSS